VLKIPEGWQFINDFCVLKRISNFKSLIDEIIYSARDPPV
jgi:hypothetical protein